MRKRGILLLVFILLIIGISFNVNAQNVSKIQKAYQCIDNLVNNASTGMNLDEAIFTALANVPGNKSWNIISNEKSPSEWCWPKAGCNVKTTAQVAIVYDHLGKDTKNITKWLLSKNGTISGFTWYLQVTIDNNEVSQCKINYDNIDYTLNVNNEMRLVGNLGGCLAIDSNGYKMKISNNCVNKVFGVNCDKGYKINLLYEKSMGGTLYVSSRTESGSANSWKSLEINAKCFKEGNACNYEASLWAATALYATGENYQPFIPYLSVLSEDNQKFMPNAFLSYIEGGNQHYEKLIQSKSTRPQERAYWDVSGNRYYDSALGMLALGGCKDSGEEACTNSDLKDVSNYLFDGQTEKGCWNNNNLKDSAFLLYAGWGETLVQSGTQDGTRGEGSSGGIVSVTGNETCASIDGTCRSNCSITERTDDARCPSSNEVCCVSPGGYNPDSQPDCEINGYYCVESLTKCLDVADSTLDDQYDCNPFNLVCCPNKYEEKTCSEQGGEICQVGEICNNDVVDSSDGACCKDRCKKEEEFECASDDECRSGEVCEDGRCVAIPEDKCSSDDECTEGQICMDGACVAKPKGNNTWIIILVILIVLALIGIIFKNKIRMFLFARKGKGKPGAGGGPGGPQVPGGFGGRFGFGGSLTMGRAPPRFGPSPGMRPILNTGRPQIRPSPVVSKPVQPIAKPSPTKKMTEKEKDMEETLKKLKKMAE